MTDKEKLLLTERMKRLNFFASSPKVPDGCRRLLAPRSALTVIDTFTGGGLKTVKFVVLHYLRSRWIAFTVRFCFSEPDKNFREKDEETGRLPGEEK